VKSTDLLADAGVRPLALPTPFAVGRVNTYLIEDEPLTLIDVGPNSGETLYALERGLAEHRRRVEDLELIVISHQHMDHFGLVHVLAERSGANNCCSRQRPATSLGRGSLRWVVATQRPVLGK
jgi:glyoxylase-like metal-dependent hydrolase (beta-lactamase superfamily II)